MWIDIQIPAHLRQQVAADFFPTILEGGEFPGEVQAAMAALAFVSHELARDLSGFAPACALAARIPRASLLHSRTDLSERQAGVGECNLSIRRASRIGRWDHSR